jgi:hypothetical protein
VTFEKYSRILDNLLDRHYDNFPKHPGTVYPFHHKHISKRQTIQLHEAPKLIDVIEEALRYMF